MNSVRNGGQSSDRYNVRAVERALSILGTLTDGKPHTLMEISEAIELNSSTTFRLLATLLSLNYVDRKDDSGHYTLGLACLELARAYLASNDVRRAAMPELEHLRDATMETVHLAVLDHMDVVYLEKLPGLHAVGLMSSRVGGRSPVHCTGVGKVLLSYLDRQRVAAHFRDHDFRRFTATTIVSLDALCDELDNIRQRGYGFDRGEHEAEVRCVAAPIFDMSGRIAAAISVSGPANRMDPLEEQKALIDMTVRAAREISARLGYRAAGVEGTRQAARTVVNALMAPF